MNYLGNLKYFFRIEVSQLHTWIFSISMKICLGTETGMSKCQVVNTPIEEGRKLCVE